MGSGVGSRVGFGVGILVGGFDMARIGWKVGSVTVGKELGAPRITVGPMVVAVPVKGITVLDADDVGLMDGHPGTQVGPAAFSGKGVLGLEPGAPGTTVGPAMVTAPDEGHVVPHLTKVGLANALPRGTAIGAEVLGLELGEPGTTVGPARLEAAEEGLPSLGADNIGLADGFPGNTVGPAGAGVIVSGIEVVGLALGAPGVTVGAATVREEGLPLPKDARASGLSGDPVISAVGAAILVGKEVLGVELRFPVTTVGSTVVAAPEERIVELGTVEFEALDGFLVGTASPTIVEGTEEGKEVPEPGLGDPDSTVGPVEVAIADG